MADTRDITGKNRRFTGTDSIKLPEGTTAQRNGSPSAGDIRFNTTLNLAEYYTGTNWKAVDSPPTITSASPNDPVDDGSTATTVTLTGTSFQSSGSTLKLIGNDATEYSISSFTVVSDTSITFSYTTALAGGGTNTPYQFKYTNPSGLAGTLAGFAPNVGPVFAVASGSLGTISEGANGSTFTQPTATDTAGGTLVYSISDGALPTGVSQDSSTGALSGTASAAGTYNFTVQVTDGTTTIERQYNATVVNPYIVATGGTVSTSGDYKTHIFTGSGCFVVTNAGTPGGADTVSYLVVAGGGYGRGASGGGGGGGYREGGVATQSPWTGSPLSTTTGVPLSVTTYPITVGGGGGTNANGGNSVFSTITSAGGGSSTVDGGSGGGATRDGPGTQGSGNTPPVSPPQGNNGGNAPVSGWCGGGGGGGAGGTGGNGAGGSQGGERAGPGGSGTTTHISGSPVTYAGGGAAYSQQGTHGSAGPGGGGSVGSSGGSNRGGGGGGNGANGGSGYVVIRYKYQ